MKYHIPNFIGALAAVSLVGSANASVYIDTFETGYSPGDINGQNGWTSNGATADSGYMMGVGGPFGSVAATIGFVSPLNQSSVYVSHAADTPLIGSYPTSFSALFQVQDSNTFDGSANRDKFGFRLENSAGANLFSFILTPFDQDPSPQTDTNFNTYSWSTGAGSPTTVLSGLAAQELNAYTFTVNFFNAGSGNVGFNANINNLDFFSGTLTGLASETISEVGAIWTPTYGASDPGTNFMIFDNISLVPEPSAALLGALGTLALLRRRRL